MGTTFMGMGVPVNNQTARAYSDYASTNPERDVAASVSEWISLRRVHSLTLAATNRGRFPNAPRPPKHEAI